MLPQNGISRLSRAEETKDLLNAVQELIIPFIRSADINASKPGRYRLGPLENSLVKKYEPEEPLKVFNFELPEGDGNSKQGLLQLVGEALNTNPVGVVSELVIAVLNTNVHVYHVFPALTIIEKLTARRLSNLFGMCGESAGGISTQGRSASNATALVIARHHLYPETKIHGNGNHKFAIFTSVHSHYSIERAAQMVGFGTYAVKSVPADSAGRMIPSELERLVEKALRDKETPLFVNATEGTTVLGAFDPIVEISQICRLHRLWLHVDSSLGGSLIFSKTHRHKLEESHLADSLAVNPHKMLGIPVTCSFLLTPDLGSFYAANASRAAYLFHEDDLTAGARSEMWDIGDQILQCGRRGDSLKLALSWIYYGASGFEAQIDNAFQVAAYFASLVEKHRDLTLVSSNPPQCLQVCFYLTPDGRLPSQEEICKMTRRVVKGLIHRIEAS